MKSAYPIGSGGSSVCIEDSVDVYLQTKNELSRSRLRALQTDRCVRKHYHTPYSRVVTRENAGTAKTHPQWVVYGRK